MNNKSYDEAKALEDEDSRLIKGGDLTTEVYAFGKPQQFDFTVNGWTAFGNSLGVSITKIVRNETDKVYQVDARGTILEPHPETGEFRKIHRWGGHEQPKTEKVRGKLQEDPWAYTQSLVKAQRNAFKAHVRDQMPSQGELKEMYLEQQRTGQPQPMPQPSEMPPAEEKAELPASAPSDEPNESHEAKARREMFEVYKSDVIQEAFANNGIDDDMFKAILLLRYEVASREYMKSHHYRKTTSELKRILMQDGSLAHSWILGMALEMKGESEAPAAPPEPPPTEDTEDDVTKARKTMFALYNDDIVQECLKMHDIDEDAFKQILYIRFNVESRADMTAAQYGETTHELRKIQENDESLNRSWILDVFQQVQLNAELAETKDEMGEYGGEKADWSIDTLREHATRVFDSKKERFDEMGITKASLFNAALKHFGVEKFGKKEWILFTDALEYDAFPSWIEALNRSNDELPY